MPDIKRKSKLEETQKEINRLSRKDSNDVGPTVIASGVQRNEAI